MNYIKKYRLEAGLTQNELADLLNVDQSLLSRYESNTRQPSFAVCVKLCKILKLKNMDVTIEDIRKY